MRATRRNQQQNNGSKKKRKRKSSKKENNLVTPTPDKVKVKEIIKNLPQSNLISDMRQKAKSFTDKAQKSIQDASRKHIRTESIYKAVWKTLFGTKYTSKPFDINKDYYWQRSTIRNYEDSDDEGKIQFPATKPNPPLKSFLKGPAQSKITSFTTVTNEKPASKEIIEIDNSTEKDDQVDNQKPPEKVKGSSAKTRKEKKKKPIKKSKNTKVSFDSNEYIRVIETDDQDDINTIASDQTSKYQSKKEEEKQIPPKYIRFRLGFQLDQIDAAVILNEDEEDIDNLTPAQRVRNIFKDLVQYIHSNVDQNAMFVSWKNSEGFSTMSVKISDEFPKEVVQIATFFDGYRSNMKSKNRLYFKFCLHSAYQTEEGLLKKLDQWREPNGFVLYKCTVQAESARIIGWLVYTLGFTNVESIKKLLSEKTSYEWGFVSNVITSADKEIAWRERLKALQVMVPSNKAEIAKDFVTSIFSQKAEYKKYTSLSDCYIFVGTEKQCQGEKLATIYSAMVGRHKFRELHSEIVLVQSIIKDIDTCITTKDNEEVTLRQMILDLEPKENKYGPQKLFHSIDYTSDAGKVWFKNKTGTEGAVGYYLSYYSWDEAEALHVKDGLGLYLGQKFGKSGIYDYFSPDHWNKLNSWKYNSFEDKWETPEEIAMAANVINDPTAQVIQAYIDQKRADLPTEISVPQGETNQLILKDEENDVTVLQHRVDTTENQNYTIMQLNEQEELAEKAKSVAYSIRSSHSQASYNDDDSDENSSTLSELAKRRAVRTMQAERDADMDSLEGVNDKQKVIHNVIQHDDVSHASSLTDITNNTLNKTYHNEESNSTISKVSTLSIKSLKESDLKEVITEDMTESEIEHNIQTFLAMQIRRSKQKAKGLIERAKQIKKEKELLQEDNNKENPSETLGESTTLVRGKQKEDNDLSESQTQSVQNSNTVSKIEPEDTQSDSNCNAISQE